MKRELPSHVMVGRIDEVEAIGDCSVELISRNQVQMDLKGTKSDEFGVSILLLLEPEIAKSGGLITTDWGWAPSSMEILSQDGVPLVFERKSNPFSVVIPKRTAGFDPRKIQIIATWNAELLKKLVEMGRTVFSFNIQSEATDDENLPILFDFGRGMREDGKPNLISNTISINSQLYTPISAFENRSEDFFRRYPDRSIHVDNMGPYFFTKSDNVSVSEPLLNFSRIDVEQWDGVVRKEDDLPYSTVVIDDSEYSGISHQACCFELLGLLSLPKGVSSENHNIGRISNLVGHLIESQGKDGMWEHDCPLVIHGNIIEEGWRSCLTQSLGAMGLIRAGEFLGDTSLKRHAEKALMGLVKDNELSCKFNNWRIFRHCSGGPLVCVLSSHLYALMAIADLVEVKGTKYWRGLLSDVLKDTESVLALYDNSNSTYYDLSHIFLGGAPNTSNAQYHCTHVMQLFWIAKKLDSEIISKTYERWESYITGSNYFA